MGKPTRNQQYEDAGWVPVFDLETTLGWRVIRNIRAEVAAMRLALGTWRRVNDGMGNFLGVQLMAAEDAAYRPSGPTAAVLTLADMECVAGLRGSSRTRQLPASERRKETFTPDMVERAEDRLAEWPLMHGDRAVRVYPRT
jgi:hypothetical protein